MGDKGASSPVVTAASEGGATATVGPTNKKATTAKSKKPRAKPSHPKTADMVNSAIKELAERGGSSLQAIKKYMAGTYKIDTEKQAPFIKKYLKAAVASGVLVQTKGKGAAGSFKLSTTKTDAVKPKAKTAAKAAAPKKAPAVKKPATPKKPAAAAKKAPVKKAAATTVAQKKKASKGPAAKPPKPKTTKPKPATAKSPAKKTKPAAAKKAKPAPAAKPKKAAPKKTTVAKK